jgi:hypothetical protein
MADNITITLHAAADSSAHQYHVVKGAGENGFALITNANAEIPIGILQDDPDGDGKPGAVCVFGKCKAELGGTVTAYQKLSFNNDGELIAAPYEAAIGTADLYVVATALESGGDGDIIGVLCHGFASVPGSTE